MEHISHLEKILPKIAALDWSHMSIHEIKAAESEMVEELDSLRQVDANTGHFTYSNEYRVLESQFKLLLDAYDCLFKKEYVDSLLRQQRNSNGQESFHAKNRGRFQKAARFLIPFRKCISVNLDAES